MEALQVAREPSGERSSEQGSRSTLEARILQRAASDEGFRQQLLRDPRGALQEAFGLAVPEGVSLTVVEETATNFCLVLPARLTTIEEVLLRGAVELAVRRYACVGDFCWEM